MNYFKALDNSKIVCNLCAHHCKLKLEQVGVCGVNKNSFGKLENLVFNHPSALHIDPIEKKPLYHFLPSSKSLSLGTVGCNFKCPFCQNWQISQTHNIDKSINITSSEVVSIAINHECKSISYTYNEPTIFYPYAKEIGLKAKEHGIKNIFVTNGFQSHDMILDFKSFVDAANVDLKSFNKEYYKKELKGNLEVVLNNIKEMVKNGIWVEITTLLIDGINTQSKEIEQMAKFIKDEVGDFVPWHLSAFHPDFKMLDKEHTKFQTLQTAFNIAKNVGLKYVYLGNVKNDTHTICPNCHEVLIKRDGFFVSLNRVKNGHCFNCNYKLDGVFS